MSAPASWSCCVPSWFAESVWDAGSSCGWYDLCAWPDGYCIAETVLAWPLVAGAFLRCKSVPDEIVLERRQREAEGLSSFDRLAKAWWCSMANSCHRVIVVCAGAAS